MEVITIPHIHIPSIDIGGICLPGIGVPDGGKKGLVWPKGLKESIKAIYDPAKQGMTNYDVIESYAEDFTIWGKKPERATITVTNKTINITNVKEPLLSIIEDNRIPFSDLVVEVTGVSEETYLTVRSGNLITQTIKTDGVYKISTNNKYLAFGVSKVGDCNITITQLPTSILKDFSGNGNHAYLYGGKGKLNSGMGVYQEDFTTFNKNDNVATYENVSPNICHIIEFKSTIAFLYKSTGTKINSITVKISGNFNGTTIVWQYYLNDKLNSIDISEPGIYTLPGSDGTGRTSGFYNRVAVGKVDITITQIPDYPNQLCYDGKMYAVCYDFPILTDYTVMADRTWFENRNVFLAKGNISTEAKYAFIFERFKPDGVMAVQSFGSWNDVASTTDSCISYLTKNKYNGIDIKSGISADDDMLSIGGALNKGNIELTSVCCHGKIIIADRSFTEDEITWLKDNWKKI